MYKYDLHIHTRECDKVALSGGAETVKMYASSGYSGIVVTDHYFSMFFDWFEDEIRNKDHKQIIDRYLKGYHSALNEAEKIGFKVFCGAEVRFDDTINDYLIYGLEEKDFYMLPFLNRLHNVEELISVLPDYAIVVQAHPFRDNMTVMSPEMLFGIEVYNGCTEKIRNDMAKMFADYYNKPCTSGSDFHCADHLARGGIETNVRLETPKDLVCVLKSGNYKIIENY